MTIKMVPKSDIKTAALPSAVKEKLFKARLQGTKLYDWTTDDFKSLRYLSDALIDEGLIDKAEQDEPNKCPGCYVYVREPFVLDNAHMSRNCIYFFRYDLPMILVNKGQGTTTSEWIPFV